MVDIDQNSFFGSFLPEVIVKKIVLEQNNGFYKSIVNPHISSPQEREARYSENNAFDVKVDLETRTRKVAANKSSFIDEKIIKESVKIAIFATSDIPRQGFQARFQQIASLPLYSSGQKKQFSINDFDKQIITNLNNTEFLVKKYNLDKFHYNNEPENLFIVYGAFVELPAYLRNDFGFDARIFGPVKVETIIQNGNMRSKSSVFVVKDTQQIWAGGFTREGNDILTSEQVPRLLEEYSINNYKLQDLRIKSKIDKEKINFKEFNEELLLARTRPLISNSPSKKIYFSDIFLSNRESSNFYFSTRFNNIILDNCKLNKIYENLNTELKQKILDDTIILSFKVLRRRVAKEGLSTNRLTDERMSFSTMKGEKEETLVNITNKKVSDLIEAEQDNCEVKEIYSSFKSLNDSRNFFIKDLDLINKTKGLYQYGVEIEISDPSNSIIIEDIRKLQDYNKFLKFGLSDLEKLQAYTTVVEVENLQKEIYYSDPHIDIPQENIAKLKNAPTFATSGQDPIIREAIAFYFQVMKKYFINIDEQKLEQLRAGIEAQSSLFVSDTTGLENFINLYEKLITDLQQLADDKIFIFDDPHILGDFGNIVKRNKNSYILKNYFSNDLADAEYLTYKNVNYINKQNTRFNELTSREFIDLIKLLKDNNLYETNSRILPFSIFQGEESRKTPDGTIKLYDHFGFGYQRKLREQIGQHANITLKSFSILESTQQEQAQEANLRNIQEQVESLNLEERHLANRDREPEVDRQRNINRRANNSTMFSFYEYCSKNLVKNKNIDEVFELYEEGQKEEFFSKFEFLRSLGSTAGVVYKQGIWQGGDDLRSISYASSELQFGANTYLMCKFSPLKNNYKNKNWNISEGMNYTDTFFIVNVPTRPLWTEIQSVLGPNTSIPAVQEEAEVPAVDLEPETGTLELPPAGRESAVIEGIDVTDDRQVEVSITVGAGGRGGVPVPPGVSQGEDGGVPGSLPLPVGGRDPNNPFGIL